MYESANAFWAAVSCSAVTIGLGGVVRIWYSRWPAHNRAAKRSAAQQLAAFLGFMNPSLPQKWMAPRPPITNEGEQDYQDENDFKNGRNRGGEARKQGNDLLKQDEENPEDQDQKQQGNEGLDHAAVVPHIL